jgi:type IV pilus assembly protein PilC
MPLTFRWKGKNLKGAEESGDIVAETTEMAVSTLRRQGIILTSITEKKTVVKKKAKAKGKITQKDVVIFTRQFSTMFSAGIPIVQGLDIMATQTENKVLAEVIGQIKGDVESGSTLADSMRKHPKVFDNLFVNLVAAGEAGGILDGVLLRLANYIEKAMKLTKKVKGAMIYPLIVISVAVLVVAIIMIFVIPVFTKIFSEGGQKLPLPTAIVVSISNFLRAWYGGGSIFVGIFSFIFGLKAYRKTIAGLRHTDAIMLKMPIIGDLLRKVAVARFTRTLGTLISSGVPILDALEICAKTAGNMIIEDLMNNVRKEVSSGKTLSEPLTGSPIFPAMATQMINVGESTGALDTMLVKIADFYDDEVDDAVNNLTAALEPLMMMFLGVVIGFIVVALYMPIFKMGDVVN